MHPANACGVVIGLLLVACGSSDESPLRRARGVVDVTSNDAGDATSSEAVPSMGGAFSFAGGAGTSTTLSAGGAGAGAAGAPPAMGAGAATGGVSPGDGGRAGDAGPGPGDDAGVPDGAATANGGSAGCAVRHVWYADADGDGSGDMATPMVGCAPPAAKGWVDGAGDCDDRDARVHPGQTVYYGEPYLAAGDLPSFDYDCSGDETLDPAERAAPASCGLLSIANCTGSGYLPTTRKGPGVNPLCGSVQTSTCTPSALVLCQAVTATVADAARCH